MALFTQAAEQILRDVQKPLHSKEITLQAIKKGLLESAGKTPEKTMSARISDDIKNRGDLSVFKKVGPNTFQLNDERLKIDEELKKDKIIEELEAEEQKEAEGGYVGEGGEHAVLSELLFRGYNAGLIAVDVGIDLIALKDGRKFNIQVKTRNDKKKNASFDFNVRVASFERHNAGDTFYIFVMRDSNTLDYLILPLNQIEKSISEDFIRSSGKESLYYRVTIRKRGGQVYVGRKENDMTFYLNNWKVLK